MKLILISSEGQNEQEHVLLNSFFEEGLETFHLRKPRWTLSETRAYLERIPTEYHNRIVVHDHYRLATETDLRGIHRTARNEVSWSDVKEMDVQKSTSCHGLRELADVDSSFTYAFLSPVFDSISKQGYKQAFEHTELETFLNTQECVDTIALGGVHPENILQCSKMGFNGVAVLGAIWNDENPLEAYRNLNKTCQESVLTY